jgi:membrane protein YdbS with pleckstrin-like domain
MIDWLPMLLRVAGLGIIALALAHIQMSRVLRWREEAALMSPASESVFHVHTLFVCAILVMIGLPALIAPQIFLERSDAGAWLTWTCSAFWLLRLLVQWFVFPSALWRGKPFETRMHILFTMVWAGLTALFVACGLVQMGRLQ